MKTKLIAGGLAGVFILGAAALGLNWREAVEALRAIVALAGGLG